jgi:hypothetical protein
VCEHLYGCLQGDIQEITPIKADSVKDERMLGLNKMFAVLTIKNI